MFAKVVVFALVAVSAVMAQADKYPAGVHPATCPNYPYCDNTVVAQYQAWGAPIAREYPAGVHPAACPNYPYCNNAIPAHAVAYASLAPPAGVPAAARYPAGVSPAACPNYPYCH
ncbi:cuticle protein 1 [Neocloeon triangulifer]|uniref:cuticle protein 1 n=1 Tax=Neocloeon triangulifer TaxID=2078957 RepID=UPI00286F1F6A|nr:cuticle protein 1 [Neocloeon triangulifer]